LYGLGFSGKKPTLFLTSNGSSVGSIHKTNALPEEGVKRPIRILIVVVFPAALGPRKPVIPFLTFIVRLSKAFSLP